jgi:DNA-binding response OmpR family regulator
MAIDRPLKILIVDDSEDHLILLTQFVKRTSVPTEAPVSRSDGTSAIAALVEGTFDCLLLDFELPDTNGLEILRKAKEIHPDTAVVMVTAKGDEELAVSTMKAGAMDYLVKGNVGVQTMERVLRNVKERLELQRTLRDREETLIQAERQRVMVESVGAACHHFSQPITSLSGRLELLIGRKPPLEGKDMRLLEECVESTKKMQELLFQFQKVTEYRTIPYTDKVNIIDID